MKVVGKIRKNSILIPKNNSMSAPRDPLERTLMISALGDLKTIILWQMCKYLKFITIIVTGY